MIELYGLNKIGMLSNWFSNYQTIILFMLLVGVFVYLFYKQNFSINKYSYSAGNHYGLNFLLIGGFLFSLFFVSKYLLNLDLIFSLIITVVFYSISIFILTLILIFIRRHKLKKWLIYKVDWLNKDEKIIDNAKDFHIYLHNLKNECEEAGHKYADMLIKDIKKHRSKDSKVKQIDVDKYKNINIWKDENMNTKI